MHDLGYDVCVQKSWRTSENSTSNQVGFGAPESSNCSQTALHLRNPADRAQFKADPSTDAARPWINPEKNMMKTERNKKSIRTRSRTLAEHLRAKPYPADNCGLHALAKIGTMHRCCRKAIELPPAWPLRLEERVRSLAPMYPNDLVPL